MSLKKKNRKLIIKLLFIFIYIFPVKGLGYFSGFPFSSKTSLILFVLMATTIFKAHERSLTRSIVFFTALFLLKFFFILNPQNLWLVCVNDDSTPIQNSFKYEYYDSTCAKSFNNLNSEFTDKVNSVSYQTYDEDYQWLGANSANFPLGYFPFAKSSGPGIFIELHFISKYLLIVLISKS